MKKKFIVPEVKLISMATAQVIAQSTPIVTFSLDGPSIDEMYSKKNKNVFFGNDEE